MAFGVRALDERDADFVFMGKLAKIATSEMMSSKEEIMDKTDEYVDAHKRYRVSELIISKNKLPKWIKLLLTSQSSSKVVTCLKFFFQILLFVTSNDLERFPLLFQEAAKFFKNGLDTKVEKSRKQMRDRNNMAKKIQGVKKTNAGDDVKVGKKK
ncbi:uncharacterized protein LOC131657377 isoform X2 [Vicia villosa]|uniref:uncharacterized protein LOC131657377 isoform X2 n=1 Tax=Vicia villosa TaxID=3911 RepID=UPI00273B3C19|nr:uncharacterized protein LOC131657377 isoform X2 [Vicia villosa]